MHIVKFPINQLFMALNRFAKSISVYRNVNFDYFDRYCDIRKTFSDYKMIFLISNRYNNNETGLTPTLPGPTQHGALFGVVQSGLKGFPFGGLARFLHIREGIVDGDLLLGFLRHLGASWWISKVREGLDRSWVEWVMAGVRQAVSHPTDDGHLPTLRC